MPSAPARLSLLVAAGGTGGHLYPAIAVARELLRRVPEASVTFVGTTRGLETRLVPRAGFPLRTVRVEPLRGGSVVRKMKGVLMLPLAAWDAWRLLRRLKPQVVLGVGGYVSGPLLALAALSGTPTVLLEPNATPGLANRWLARLVDAAAVAWEETLSYFPGKAFLSGNPVRVEISRVGPPPAGDLMSVLVFGGSQGSRVLNQAMVASLEKLEPEAGRLSVTHQTGQAELEAVRAAYRAAGFEARVEPYLERMEREYAEAHLVVSRAGATTCAELAASGRASILVPLPLAGAHQEENALAMERAGAARVIRQSELTGERLASEILKLLEAPSVRERMAEDARRLARPDAAGAVVEKLLALSGKGAP